MIGPEQGQLDPDDIAALTQFKSRFDARKAEEAKKSESKKNESEKKLSFLQWIYENGRIDTAPDSEIVTVEGLIQQHGTASKAEEKAAKEANGKPEAVKSAELKAVEQYDAALQMFVQNPEPIDMQRLRFMRWLTENGRLEHQAVGPSSGELVIVDVAALEKQTQTGPA